MWWRTGGQLSGGPLDRHRRMTALSSLAGDTRTLWNGRLTASMCGYAFNTAPLLGASPAHMAGSQDTLCRKSSVLRIVGHGYRLLRACVAMQGWFDDRVEARNALAKVAKLWQISGFDHAELPWMDVGDREGRMFNKALL